MLYEVAILERPTKKEAGEGQNERLVFDPKAVVAHDPQAAAISAVLDEGANIKVDRSRLEVLVRPFV